MKVLSFIKNKAKAISIVSAALVVGGASTTVVLAAIPDSGGVIHACYSTGLLGKVKIIDSPSQHCGLGETAISWNQQGPKGDTGATGPQGPAGGSGSLEYAASASEKTLTTTQSSSLDERVDLGGPQITTNVPSGSTGALLSVFLSSEMKSPCDLGPIITVVEEPSGTPVGSGVTNSGENGTLNFTPYTIGGTVDGSWRAFPIGAGSHTYGVRYSLTPAGENTTCTATFQNIKLWAKLEIPN